MECACIHDCEHIEFILCVAQTSRTWSMASAILWKKSHIVIKSMKRISYCFNKFEWCSHTNNETANTIPTVAFSIFSFSIDNWRTLACERAWVVFAAAKSSQIDLVDLLHSSMLARMFVNVILFVQSHWQGEMKWTDFGNMKSLKLLF